MNNLFDRSSEQEFTWQSKHIKFFLDLKGFGPATVEKIIDINPNTNPGQVQVHHYDNYNTNKKKMNNIPFKPAYSNDSIDNPIEVYARKISSKMIKTYGSFTKMRNWIPQGDVILCFDNLTTQSKVPADVITQYRSHFKNG